MKTTSISCGLSGGHNGIPELAWRWGATFLGQRRAADRTSAGRTIEFVMDKNSLWRIAGSVRGVRIDCRQGRMWLTQAGAAADVILQAGQSYVADGAGAIVVQPVPSFDATEAVVLGTLMISPSAARLQIHRRQTVAATARIGMDAADRDRTAGWEQLAFIAFWLCGVFSVGYCLKTLMSLPWPQ